MLSGLCTLFIALVGTVSGLIIWHTVPLGVLTAGVMALMAIPLWSSLALIRYTEETPSGSKATVLSSPSKRSA
jgi:hypothetical protein